MTALVRYEAACAALDAAVTADEVMQVHTSARAIESVARVAKNLDFELKGAKLRIGAEVKLGEMLTEAREQGLLRSGPEPKDINSDAETISRLRLREIGIDPKLSSRAQKLSGIGAKAVNVMLDQFERESRKRGRVATDVITSATAKRNAESRRQLARELSDTSAQFPSGRRYAVVLADPAWKRKAGVGNRAYENVYTTMTWQAICDLPVKDILLPDAWVFLWIPRAHAFALHPIEIDTPLGRATVKMPLGWAIAKSWGCDAYSTCFVWTKTGEENPDEHGLGLIAWDQDELLLMFKRGNGLPKPDTDKKYGSNHREPPREHSRKPEHYRRMLRDMAGEGVPVLELFARVDPENPFPADWYVWGNQSGQTDSSGNTLNADPITGEIQDEAAE